MNDVNSRAALQPSTTQQVAEMMAVPGKPGYVDAFVKIASTIAREAYAMDKQDWALLVAQYTEDAVFETRPH